MQVGLCGAGGAVGAEAEAREFAARGEGAGVDDEREGGRGLEPPVEGVAEGVARLVETVNESRVRRPARRPRYTPLRCTTSAELGLPPLRHWRQALAAYVSRT